MQVTVTTVRMDYTSDRKVFKTETFFQVLEVPKADDSKHMLVIRRSEGGIETQCWIPFHRIHEIEVII